MNSRSRMKTGALYIMCIPGILFLVIYKFLPLYGLTLAFKDFGMFLGNGLLDSLNKSPWVGLKYFKEVFASPEFFHLLKNTLLISFWKLVFLFPLPIIISVVLNEARGRAFRNTVQTAIYLPHFLSWVIIYGIFFSLLSSNGVVNRMIEFFGGHGINFLSNPDTFRGLLVFTEGWKETGWSCIVYLSALTGVDEALYDAAKVDGCNRMKKIWHVALPTILPTIIMMLLLKLGNLLQAGYEQILVMYNPAVYSTGDIIQTWVYRIGLGQMNFARGTVVGLFESVVGFVLIVTFNSVCRKIFNRSLW